MLFGSREGFGLEFHPEQDEYLLCVDISIGGLHVNAWDNAFYPPLLVKKLTDELPRSLPGSGAGAVHHSGRGPSHRRGLGLRPDPHRVVTRARGGARGLGLPGLG